MIQTVTPHELAITADRLASRVKTLRDPSVVRGGTVWRATLEDLSELAQQATLMHCPRADTGLMFACACALASARLVLEELTS